MVMPTSTTPISLFGTRSVLRTSRHPKTTQLCPLNPCRYCYVPETSSHRTRPWMSHRHSPAHRVVSVMEGSHTVHEVGDRLLTRKCSFLAVQRTNIQYDVYKSLAQESVFCAARGFSCQSFVPRCIRRAASAATCLKIVVHRRSFDHTDFPTDFCIASSSYTNQTKVLYLLQCMYSRVSADLVLG